MYFDPGLNSENPIEKVIINPFLPNIVSVYVLFWSLGSVLGVCPVSKSPFLKNNVTTTWAGIPLSHNTKFVWNQFRL